MKGTARRSRFAGVWWEAARRRWAAGIYQAGPPKRMVRIAHFESEEDAALAYDRVILFVRGPGAVRNFPQRAPVPSSIEEIRQELRVLAKRRMTSRWKGVSLGSRTEAARPWSSELRLPAGDTLWLGRWATEREAALAHDRAALFYLGPNAPRNLPRLPHPVRSADVRSLRAEGERARKAGASSRFRGVIWAKNTRCWRARVTVDGRLHHLGLFADEEDAARAYDAIARKAFGAAAKLNFVDIGRMRQGSPTGARVQ